MTSQLPGTSPVVPACPIGDHTNDIQRVEAVYAAGTSQSAGPSVGVVDYVSRLPDIRRLSTSLAQELAPPRAYEPNTDHVVLNLISIGMIVFGAYALMTAPSGLTTAAILVGVPIIALGVFLIWNGRKQTEEANRQYLEESARVEKQLARWRQAYYCHRDGIIFFPGDKEPVALRDFYGALSRRS